MEGVFEKCLKAMDKIWARGRTPLKAGEGKAKLRQKGEGIHRWDKCMQWFL